MPELWSTVMLPDLLRSVQHQSNTLFTLPTSLLTSPQMQPTSQCTPTRWKEQRMAGAHVESKRNPCHPSRRCGKLVTGVYMRAAAAVAWMSWSRRSRCWQVTRRSKALKFKILESHVGGPLSLIKIIKEYDDYDENDATNHDQLKIKAWERFCAYKFIKNANHAKYGKLLEHLRERKSIGKEEFPTNLLQAINTLSTYNSQL